MKKRNRQSFGRIINWQRTKVKDHSHTGSGDSSAYWQWIQSHCDRIDDGEFREPTESNPDVIGDFDNYENERHHYHELIEEGYQILSPREKQVFDLLAERKTEEEIGRVLNVSRSMVKQCRARIQNKFSSLDTKDA